MQNTIEIPLSEFADNLKNDLVKRTIEFVENKINIDGKIKQSEFRSYFKDSAIKTKFVKDSFSSLFSDYIDNTLRTVKIHGVVYYKMKNN